MYLRGRLSIRRLTFCNYARLWPECVPLDLIRTKPSVHIGSPRKTLAGGAAHKPSMYPPRIGLGYLSMHNALSIAALST